ncbi:hypothetical protein PHMEG_00029231 [Phytophthora megakarya]|uniref:Retrotransposon gag domain-containing protein n=1 Tax=Phytophthora megakarya TaxID=4795 RepID=A0A225V1L5_9STRA|nr:hypothetical protein PHMEG_00029231 [Phytophthora megakarya]
MKADSKKKSTPPIHPAGKHGPLDDETSDDDNDSDKESGDSNSDSSSFEDLAPGTQACATSQGTIMFNPMVNITALEGFDAKQPLAVRTCLVGEVTKSCGHGKMIRPCKGLLLQAEASLGCSWKRFVKAFPEEYCKAKTPDSEYYYTTFQRKSETPREFYYRLNKISTYIARDRHLKVFIKKLKDTQLRSTLRGQRNLEHILKQHEEIWWSDDREAHPLKGNDRKADVPFGNRQRQKYHNRAYNVNEDEVFASDTDQQALLDQGVECVHQNDVDGLSGDTLGGNVMLQKQNVTSEVYRILENSGWGHLNSEYRSSSKTDFGRPQQTRHCDNCGEGIPLGGYGMQSMPQEGTSCYAL